MAARLFLSHKTAEVHLSHINEKLDAHSRTSMVKLISFGAAEELPFPVVPGRDLPGYAHAHNRLIRAPPNADPKYRTRRKYSAADLAARRPANPITLCDDRGIDFVTVFGYIPMAVQTAEDDVVDMRTGKAVRAGVVLKRGNHPALGLDRREPSQARILNELEDRVVR